YDKVYFIDLSGIYNINTERKENIYTESFAPIAYLTDDVTGYHDLESLGYLLVILYYGVNNDIFYNNEITNKLNGDELLDYLISQRKRILRSPEILVDYLRDYFLILQNNKLTVIEKFNEFEKFTLNFEKIKKL